MAETAETTETHFVAPPLLTITDAANLARVSRSHTWRLVRRDEVEALRIGENGPVGIPTTEFLRWLYGTQTPEDLPAVTHSDLEPWLTEEPA
jgi:hypothetical protein